MSDYNAVFVAMRQAARECGWALFQVSQEAEPAELETRLLKVIDVRKASFSFDYNEFIKEGSPPSLGIHVSDGIGSGDKIGG
jgi:hypothetical protein